MTPKRLPNRLQKTYEALPTFDKLRDAHPELKAYQLRAMLRDVACFRCPDGSVRYSADEAAAALSRPPPTAEERDEDKGDDDLEDEDEHTRDSPRVLGALQLFNEALRLNAAQAKAQGELMKVYESTLRAMTEPFKCGVGMLTDTVKELREQNAAHVERWDKVVVLMETASSNQHQRDVEREREKTRAEFRKDLGVAVVAQLPAVLEMLGKKSAANDTKPSSSSSSGPTQPPPSDPPPGGGGTEPTPTAPPEPAPSSPPAAAAAPTPTEVAVLAFSALGSLEEGLFDCIASNLEDPAQRAKFDRFKAALVASGGAPQQQPPERQANDQSLNHASA